MRRTILADGLKRKNPMILDGAMATELEKKGLNISNTLWSASVIRDHAMAIRDVHLRYFQAGADVAITDTYQATIAGFQKAGISEEEGNHLIKAAVWAADEARQIFWEQLAATERDARLYPIIAGSVGPYGAYRADGSEYTGAYSLNRRDYQSFHFSRMNALKEADVDLFAFETMPNMDEVEALIDLLEKDFPEASAWVSFSLGDPEHLCDGTLLEKAAAWAGAHEAIAAVGVNCLPAQWASQAITSVRRGTDKPVIVYPNSGETYDPQTKSWHHPVAHVDYGQSSRQWFQLGASLLGGCCRTSPDEIRKIAEWACN